MLKKPPRLLRLLPRREPLRPLDARERAGLPIPGDEARDEEAGPEGARHVIFGVRGRSSLALPPRPARVHGVGEALPTEYPTPSVCGE